MSNHFNSRNEAIAHLTSKGFREIENGNWVNGDGLAAHILTGQGSRVLVQVWEVGA